MSGVRTMSWYMAVAVLAVATVLSWKLAIAANEGQTEFCGTVVEPYGYICAEYRTYSADGYELVMHRVSSRTSQRPDETPVSPTRETDTASLKCEDVEQPFNSPKCLLQQPSSESDIPESDEVSAPSGLHDHFTSDYVNGDQNKMDQTPSSNPTNLEDGAAQEQELLADRGLFWRDEDQESQHSHLPSQDRVEVLPRKVHRHIPRSRKSSLSDTRTEGKDHQGSSVSNGKAEVSPTSASGPFPTHDQNSVKFITGRVPVLVMHQEFLNGDSWFQLTDPADRLLPSLLVDAGFDVWIGHERATYWSHGHLHLQPTEQRYWNWTWDEHAKYDVPALLELINNITGSAAHYVGISQSAAVGAAAATMPESSKFLRSLTLIGPTIYVGFTSSIVLNAWAFVFGNTLDQMYYNEGFQSGAFNFTREFNVTSIAGRGPAGAELAAISGPNCCFGSSVVSFTNGWDGTTSFKNLLHYQQGVRTNFWRHFDFEDPLQNTQAYGTPGAPDYLPEDIPSRIPVLVIYGGQDTYSPLGGIMCLLSRLGTRSHSVFLPAYAHYDLFYSVYRARDVFSAILHFLKAHRWN